MTLSDNRLRVYIDADVLLAGLATENPSAASRVLLDASELTLLDLIVGRAVVDECERNFQQLTEGQSARQALQRSFREAVDRAVEVVDVSEPPSSLPNTDPKDVIHLAGAAEHNCDYLVTYNLNDYARRYRGVSVVEPGTLVKRIREQIRKLR